MKSFTHKEKKIARIILIPLSFLAVGYIILFFALYPLASSFYSLYSLVSSGSGIPDHGKVSHLYSKDMAEATAFSVPERGSVYGEMSIERLHLNYNVYYGDSDTELNQGLGTYPGSSLPGFQKTILIGGHAVPFLGNIDQLKVDDNITIKTFYGVYEYRIYDIKIGHKDDSSLYDLAQESNEILVLYTCYPFDGIGLKSQRYFVYAQKVFGPSVPKG